MNLSSFSKCFLYREQGGSYNYAKAKLIFFLTIKKYHNLCGSGICMYYVKFLGKKKTATDVVGI